MIDCRWQTDRTIVDLFWHKSDRAVIRAYRDSVAVR
jgi:hypothetical protein